MIATGLKLEKIFELMDIGNGGYFVLFGLLFSCGVGLPLPEDIPLLVAGALVGSGHMSLLYAAIAAWCGIIGGDCVLYLLGRRFGLNICRMPMVGRHFTQARIERAEQLFARWGIWVVAIGRMFAGIRGAMVVAAGTIRFPFFRFVLADGVAALASGGLFLFLGKKFGENLPQISKRIHHYSVELGIALAIFSMGFVAYLYWRHQKHTSMSDVALKKAQDISVHTGAATAPKTPAS